MRWADLSPVWQACLQESWVAFLAGNVPVGAVVVDGQGVIQTRGRNQINDSSALHGQVCSSTLAHAELNALLALKQTYRHLHDYSLYTALEPCPLCMGAVYMAGVRTIHYACRDDYAGSTNLLGATWYLSHKPVKAFGPHPGALEDAVFTLNVLHHLRSHFAHDDVLHRQRAQIPCGALLGEQLFARGAHLEWQNTRLEAPTCFNQLFSLLEDLP